MVYVVSYLQLSKCPNSIFIFIRFLFAIVKVEVSTTLCSRAIVVTSATTTRWCSSITTHRINFISVLETAKKNNSIHYQFLFYRSVKSVFTLKSSREKLSPDDLRISNVIDICFLSVRKSEMKKRPATRKFVFFNLSLKKGDSCRTKASQQKNN